MKTLSILITTLLLIQFPTIGALGDVVIKVESVQVADSADVQTGSFEIYVAHDLETDPELAGFQLLMTLVANSDAQARFTSVEAPSSRSYAFSPNSSAPVGNVNGDGTIVQAGDFLLSGTSTLFNGNALARINFEIDGGFRAGDTVDLLLSTDPSETFLAFDATGRLDFTSENGLIFVAVPEPVSTTGLVLAFVALGAGYRRRVSSIR